LEQPSLDLIWIPLSREKEFLFSFTTETAEPTPPLREDVVSSKTGKADAIG